MFCGETFLPPAVTMMSFFRSVIARNPSSIEPTSPVRSQPSLVERLARGGLVLVVAAEDVRARG